MTCVHAYIVCEYFCLYEVINFLQSKNIIINRWYKYLTLIATQKTKLLENASWTPELDSQTN